MFVRYLVNNPQTKYLPILFWLKSNSSQDLMVICSPGISPILIVPQGIAYAMLAGLPEQMGLYASIIPTAIYTLLGTSRTLTIGPVSIAAIMVASALSLPEIKGVGDSAQSALIMILMALTKMGGLVNFISHPVLAGFTSSAAE
jgi:sulfate permease, SulP family